ncbi:MAG: hypothetical protein IH855_09865 [Bacteroidetes bacterium]|nr:hypothetical protein [Bacteroidota bacterium]
MPIKVSLFGGRPGGIASVIGHPLSGGREFSPPGRVLEDPSATKRGDWVPEEKRPRSAHVPAYAPRLLPGVAQLRKDINRQNTTANMLNSQVNILSTNIHNLTATKHGERAAAAWAIMRHLGRQGYVESTRHVLEVRDFIVNGMSSGPEV